MTAEHWQRVKTIFRRAMACDPAVRAEYLREQCGSDEELRRDVESLMNSDDGPPPPIVVSDRYEVERELGRGGMSVVYLAKDRLLMAKHVVVKVLLEETSQDPWVRQKFLQEMEGLSRIDHPGVVGVLDTGFTADGQRFLVMQYIEGTTLRSAIQPGGMDFVRAAGILRQMGQALEAAHEKGVWHRDLKPENVMLQSLGGEDHVKLIDFGIAGIQNSQFTTEQTQVAGSLAYMAPEQLNGRPCAASDTYSLAVLATEILTGVRTESPREVRADLPETAERSIRRARSLQPEARHASVREFSEELCNALCGRTSTGKTARRSAVPGSVEMAHVLFTDLVGYSLLPMDRQKEYLAELQWIVRESRRFAAAEAEGDLISLPTGDGMALAFFGDPTAAAQCALEVAAGLKSKPHLKLRMGIHSGPVYRVADVNANANVAGGGINMAQRVMDCGDAGHILMSKTVADVLLELSQWSPYLTNLGEFTVKHGAKVHLYNLATAEAGNVERPRKLPGVPVTTLGSKVPRSAWLLGTAAVVLALVLAGFLVWRPVSLPSPPRHSQVTFVGDATYPAISPDGKSFAYVAGKQGGGQKLMVQDVKGGDAIELMKGASLFHPRWSPDGSELVVASYGADKTWSVYVIPRLGGQARFVANGTYACWSPTGRQIAMARSREMGFRIVDKVTGEVKPVRFSGFQYWNDVDWSPDGKQLAIWVELANGRNAIWTVPVGGGQPRKVVEEDELSSPRWSTTGDSIYYLHGKATAEISKVSIDAKSGERKGTPLVLLSGLQIGDYFTIANDGAHLAYARSQSYSNLWSAESAGPDGSREMQTRPLTSGTSEFHSPSISPDGKWIAYSNRRSIFKVPAEGGKNTQLTVADAFHVGGTAWSPDGKRIAYGSDSGGSFKVWIMDADGSNRRRLDKTQLSPSCEITWSPGSQILYQRPGNQNFRAIDADTGEERPLAPDDSTGVMYYARYSPDAQKVAAYWNRRVHDNDAKPQPRLWVISLADRSAVALDENLAPAGWSPDGKSLFAFHFPWNGTSVVAISSGGGNPRTVFTLPGDIEEAVVSADGKRIVSVVPEEKSDVWMLENFDPSRRK